MQYVTWGLRYADACTLIDDLKAAGIHAQIVPGGLAAYPAADAASEMKRIAAVYGATFVIGETPHQQTVADAYALRHAGEGVRDG